MLIISYIRRVPATGYEIINFVKCLKGSRETRALISNINTRKKRRYPLSSKLLKSRIKEESISFPKPKNREYLIRFSVRYIHVPQYSIGKKLTFYFHPRIYPQ